MDVQLYRLRFNRTHFGEGSLLKVSPLFSSHRLFSALFLEAMKMKLESQLLELALDDSLVISNGLFYEDSLFLPKPIGYPEQHHLKNGRDPIENRQNAKESKRLTSISFDDFDEFVSGEIELVSDLVEEEKRLYRIDYMTRKGEDPYRVAYTSYHSDIAVIMSKNTLVQDLMKHLQFSGLGGKRSSGFGRFHLTIEPIPSEIHSRLSLNSQQPVMLLNDAFPIDENLQDSLEGAHYLTRKAAGYSYTESDSFFRKQDFYTFKSGSTFNKTFKGDLYNLAPDDISHPVWHYSKPLFFRLGES